MVINPTYLSKVTQTCMLPCPPVGLMHQLMLASRQLADCPTESQTRLPTMAQISTRSDHRPMQSISAKYLQAPEIQTMYSLNIPVSQLRTKVRQEFERHRYVNKLPVVDMLLFQSNAEFQVRIDIPREKTKGRI